MRLPPEARFDLLALLGPRVPMQPLLDRLAEAGFGVNLADGLQAARTAFFGAGGVHCVLVGPDVSDGMAGLVVHSLREVDPELPVASFGPALERRAAPARTAVFAALHPSSRAGAGALLRFLRRLPERAGQG